MTDRACSRTNPCSGFRTIAGLALPSNTLRILSKASAKESSERRIVTELVRWDHVIGLTDFHPSVTELRFRYGQILHSLLAHTQPMFRIRTIAGLALPSNTLRILSKASAKESSERRIITELVGWDHVIGLTDFHPSVWTHDRKRS